jgi:hypothetical protein
MKNTLKLTEVLQESKVPTSSTYWNKVRTGNTRAKEGKRVKEEANINSSGKTLEAITAFKNSKYSSKFTTSALISFLGKNKNQLRGSLDIGRLSLELYQGFLNGGDLGSGTPRLLDSGSFSHLPDYGTSSRLPDSGTSSRLPSSSNSYDRVPDSPLLASLLDTLQRSGRGSQGIDLVWRDLKKFGIPGSSFLLTLLVNVIAQSLPRCKNGEERKR